MTNKAKILIVEDEAIQANILRRILVSAGYEVFIAKDGKEALSLTPIIIPSIVITDILMPEINGYEICRQIKSNEDIPETAVILLTQLTGPSDIIKGLEARADSYITKPFDNDHLLSKIKYLIDRKITIKQKPHPHTIVFGNESHTITSSYQELFDLLIDTYENIIQQNKELTKRTMELLESENRFKFLVQNVPDIIYKLDPEGRFTFVNDSIRKLGYEPEELIGKHFSDIIYKEDIDLVSREKVLPKLKGMIIGDEKSPRFFDERRKKDRFNAPLDVRIIAKEGRFMHPGIMEPIGSDIIYTDVNSFGMHEAQPEADVLQFQGTLGVILYKKKGFVGTTGVIRDITERKKIEFALLSDKSFLENILGNIANGVFAFNDQGIIVLVNKGGASICGYKSSEIIGEHLSKILKSDKINALFDKIIHKFTHIIGEEAEIILNNGTIRTITISLIPIYFEGKIVNVVATIEDITECRQALDALAQSEERFRGISSFAIDGIVMMNEKGLITYWNKAAERIFGYTNSEIIYTNLHDKIMPKKYLNDFKAGFDKFIETGIGRIIGTTTEVIGVNKDGIEFPVEISLSAIYIKNKWNAIGIVRDITRRKMMENKLNELNKNLKEMVKKEVEAHRQKDIMLVQQSKMAAMGEMIGAIAHQWKQPLNALSLLIQDLQDAFENNELDISYVNNSVEKSLSQIEFMARTIDDFRNFFSPSKEKVLFSIVESINEIYNIIIETLKKHNIKVKLICDIKNHSQDHANYFDDHWDILTCSNAETLKLFGYQNEFKQVILNLLTNAMDAIFIRREIEEAQDNLTEKEGRIIITINKIEQDILIEISDNGGGIPDNIIKQIFDPYFTTKSDKQGTGIGLYISKNIIENNMRGTITARNIIDGALFSLRFNTNK